MKVINLFGGPGSAKSTTAAGLFYFMKLMTLLLIFSIVITLLFDITIFWDMTFRRALLLSALLDYCYFDFFDENYIYWSNSFMSRFIDYPYDISPDFIIGRDYFNRPKMNANACWGAIV